MRGGGREAYHKELDGELPEEIEHSFPDYSIYPEYSFAVAMTTRGCPRGCSFCHVAPKEGRCSHKVADAEDFYQGQKRIEVLDPNITACKDRFELYEQYKETKADIVFNQGLDIRMITEKDVDALNGIRVKELHFAWDNPKEDLKDKFELFSREFKPNTKSSHGNKGIVYCLTNFDSTMEENLYRIYTLRDLGFDPYVTVYNKANAPTEIKRLQRWCNNRFIFHSVKMFEDYQ